MSSRRSVRGVGLGLRQEFAGELATAKPADVDFVEVTAEHYFRTGGFGVVDGRGMTNGTVRPGFVLFESVEDPLPAGMVQPAAPVT